QSEKIEVIQDDKESTKQTEKQHLSPTNETFMENQSERVEVIQDDKESTKPTEKQHVSPTNETFMENQSERVEVIQDDKESTKPTEKQHVSSTIETFMENQSERVEVIQDDKGQNLSVNLTPRKGATYRSPKKKKLTRARAKSKPETWKRNVNKANRLAGLKGTENR
ncbi:unnamed protein product, partial [Owenia fusiformis]